MDRQQLEKSLFPRSFSRLVATLTVAILAGTVLLGTGILWIDHARAVDADGLQVQQQEQEVGPECLPQPRVVFVAREFARAPDPAQRASAIERASTGKLVVRFPDGTEQTLVDGGRPGAPAATPVDVADPDVSFEGLFPDRSNRFAFYGVRND